MKAILEFNLPDNQHDFDCAVDGAKWMSAMWELNAFLRSEIKHPAEGMSDDTFNTYVIVRDKLHEILDDEQLKL
jgi:hypothetical protein